jgi:hypothetical protein
MKLKEMVELVQQHHPQMGGQEIVKMINRAQDEYSSRTRLSEDSHTYTVVDGQRRYSLNVSGNKDAIVVDGQRRYSLNVSGNKDAIMEIKNVDLNGKTIKRFTGRPITRDLT